MHDDDDIFEFDYDNDNIKTWFQNSQYSKGKQFRRMDQIEFIPFTFDIAGIRSLLQPSF